MIRKYSRYDEDRYDYPEYVPVGEKRERNRKAVVKLRKKHADLRPVIIEGRSLAQTWWGKSWNANLERYADYSNRIGRGRSYARHGAVLDLRIESGMVKGLVQGSRGKPYKIEIDIKPLDAKVWEKLRETALTQLDSLSDLLAGEFPKSLRDAFFAQGTGLFPTPGEIDFDCSCPDWASMCKHVAAVLYGIGNRLDEKPEMFFTLRQVSMEEFVQQTIDSTARNLLDKATTAADEDVLEGADVAEVFGIEFDDGSASPGVALPAAAEIPVSEKKKNATTKKKKNKNEKASTTNKYNIPGSSAESKGKKRRASGDREEKKKSTGITLTSRSSGVEPKSSRKKASIQGRTTMVDQLIASIPKRDGKFGARDLEKKLSGWSGSQVRNTIQRAIADGRIRSLAPGIYSLVKSGR